MKKARRERLIRELKMGERSGFLADFDKDAFLKDLHRKHASKG
jgi:antitoxin ParD1/3/4